MRRRAWLSVVVLAMLPWVSGCFDPEYPDEAFGCGVDGECPDGFTCELGRLPKDDRCKRVSTSTALALESVTEDATGRFTLTVRVSGRLPFGYRVYVDGAMIGDHLRGDVHYRSDGTPLLRIRLPSEVVWDPDVNRNVLSMCAIDSLGRVRDEGAAAALELRLPAHRPGAY